AVARPRRLLVVEDKRPARQQGVVQAYDRPLVLLARAAEAEDAADDDRRVAARRRELVKRRDTPRGVRAPTAGAADHVRRRVATVDVVAELAQRREQPPGAAAG